MEQLLDTAELAEYLHCSERHIRQMRESEGLPCVKAGRLVRFELSKVKEWLAGEKKTATAKPKRQKSEVVQKESRKQKIDAKKGSRFYELKMHLAIALETAIKIENGLKPESFDVLDLLGKALGFAQVEYFKIRQENFDKKRKDCK